MRACVLFASPRGKESNTIALTNIFLDTWRAAGHEAEVFSLYDLEIAPCCACRACQVDHTSPSCAIHDDMAAIFESILQSDLIVFASPIYSWYCTAPLKAAMDRLVYALCKFYGAEKGPSLMEGKALCALATCGYRPENGTDLFDEGLRRWCKHTRVRYLGLHAARHLGYDRTFLTAEIEANTADFAEKIFKNM
jgi:multimeric flavodoxin WrbA